MQLLIYILKLTSYNCVAFYMYDGYGAMHHMVKRLTLPQKDWELADLSIDNRHAHITPIKLEAQLAQEFKITQIEEIDIDIKGSEPSDSMRKEETDYALFKDE